MSQSSSYEVIRDKEGEILCGDGLLLFFFDDNNKGCLVDNIVIAVIISFSLNTSMIWERNAFEMNE